MPAASSFPLAIPVLSGFLARRSRARPASARATRTRPTPEMSTATTSIVTRITGPTQPHDVLPHGGSSACQPRKDRDRTSLLPDVTHTRWEGV